jgi:hypothetical protein
MTKRECGMLGGRPTTLNEEIGQLIIDNVREFLSVNHAAEINEVPRPTVQSWINKGYEDLKEGKDSLFAWFSSNIRKARASKIQEYLKRLESNEKNWQSIAWILERCCAEDFGKDSELYKQLLEDYKMLMQSMLDRGRT